MSTKNVTQIGTKVLAGFSGAIVWEKSKDGAVFSSLSLLGRQPIFVLVNVMKFTDLMLWSAPVG